MIYHHNKQGRYGDSYALDDLETEARITVKNLKPHVNEFDSIVVTGMSGVIPGAVVSLRLKKPLVVLRKPGDDTHAFERQWINRDALGSRSLWLDDFVSLGDTRNRVRGAVAEVGGLVVAEYLTRDREYTRVT